MNTYGCWNTPRDDWFHGRSPLNNEHSIFPKDGWVFIKDTSTKDCQYRKTTQDKKCEGCRK